MLFSFFIWWGINNKVLKPKIAIAKHAKTDVVVVDVVVYVVNKYTERKTRVAIMQ